MPRCEPLKIMVCHKNVCYIIIYNLIKENLKIFVEDENSQEMIARRNVLATILSVISILIQFYKLISLKSSIDFIDILLGLLTGIELLISSFIKIKDNKEKQ